MVRRFGRESEPSRASPLIADAGKGRPDDHLGHGAVDIWLVQALAEETGKLGESTPFYDEEGRQQAEAAGAVVAAFIADLRDETAEAA